jgi:hypothetical protein
VKTQFSSFSQSFVFSSIFCLLFLSGAQAQLLEKCSVFSSLTPFQEPDGRVESIKIDQNTFVTISKTKGNIGGPAEFMLEKYDLSLNSMFKTPIQVSADEEIENMYHWQGKIYLLTIIHTEKMSTRSLVASVYDINTGAKINQKTLFENKVSTWIDDKGRGAIKQSFPDMVSAAVGRGYTTPPDYKIKLRFSPDEKLFAAYYFDYSQRNLNGQCYVFSKELEKQSFGNFHVDNNFTNYAVVPNNLGEIFIVNCDKIGRVAVIKYNLSNRQYKYLDIQSSSGKRENLYVQLLNDDVLYVANVVLGNNKLVGVMYSKFNFSTNLVERINYHEINEALRETMVHSWEYVKQSKSEDWLNYEISDFKVGNKEEILIVLEKREIQTVAYRYEQSNVVDISKWQECTGQVYAGGVFLFAFDQADNLKWENAFAKNQVDNINMGINSASYVLDYSESSKLRMLYTTTDIASGIFNVLNYVEFDQNTGKKVKDLKLQNDEQIGLVRSYTHWFPNQLILAGRKGILGRKSSICSYKLDY